MSYVKNKNTYLNYSNLFLEKKVFLFDSNNYFDSSHIKNIYSKVNFDLKNTFKYEKLSRNMKTQVPENLDLNTVDFVCLDSFYNPISICNVYPLDLYPSQKTTLALDDIYYAANSLACNSLTRLILSFSNTYSLNINYLIIDYIKYPTYETFHAKNFPFISLNL